MWDSRVNGEDADGWFTGRIHREGGLASSAWHIDQMGQPPRLGCLGMCTGQCAVVDVNSKCWRNLLVPDMCLHTR